MFGAVIGKGLYLPASSLRFVLITSIHRLTGEACITAPNRDIFAD